MTQLENSFDWYRQGAADFNNVVIRSESQIAEQYLSHENAIQIQVLDEFRPGEKPFYEFITDEGTQINIGKDYIGFLEKLRTLSPSIKMQIMHLQVQDAEDYIESNRQKKVEKIVELLSGKWFYRESGDWVNLAVMYDNEYRFGFKMSANKMIKEFQRGAIDPFKYGDKIISFFKEECYQK